ncbi:MAG: thiamine-phosphate synthase family protein, partial [Asgard group archaeon]|nr:thiamine-phosphate synthase family protein [Asgard group archaeon]
MRPPCEIVTQTMLPLLRGLVAKELTKTMTQNDAAKKMGVSQPTISSYLNSLEKITSQDEEEYLHTPSIKKLAKTISQKIIQGATTEEIINQICSICVKLRIGGTTCRKHLSQYSDLPRNCQGCLPIIKDSKITERRKILQELQEALDRIEKEPTFVHIIPQVRVNICYSTAKPLNTDDIAAIPGRITTVRGKPKAFFPPEFGASTHTAKILLTIKSKYPTIRSAICFKYNEKIKDFLKEAEIPFETFTAENFTAIVSNEAFTSNEKLYDFFLKIEKQEKNKQFAIINTGGVGIEPI